jgi:hypothetical protein
MDNIDEFRKFLLTQDPIITVTAYWIICTEYSQTGSLQIILVRITYIIRPYLFIRWYNLDAI